MKQKVLVLGACGMIGPYLTPGLEDDYDLYLTDIVPHPQEKPIEHCDITSYQQVCDAARGMDAIVNLTVVRSDPVFSFDVNVRGALNAMKAAVEHGIKKVVHTGPQYIRREYDHDFGVDDVPPAVGTNHYVLTKSLASQICQIYARTYNIQIISFVFNGLGPRPTQKKSGDFPTFTIVWEDLQLACRLALEIETVPENFQEFNMLSYEGHGKYTLEKARRILGFEPLQDWSSYFARTP